MLINILQKLYNQHKILKTDNSILKTGLASNAKLAIRRFPWQDFPILVNSLTFPCSCQILNISSSSRGSREQWKNKTQIQVKTAIKINVAGYHFSHTDVQLRYKRGIMVEIITTRTLSVFSEDSVNSHCCRAAGREACLKNDLQSQTTLINKCLPLPA